MSVMVAISEKRCADCGETKALSEFSLHNREKGYFSSYCKPCNSARTREYNKRNPERIRENNQRFKERNPDKVRAYSRAAHARHRESRNAYHRTRRAANPEAHRSYCREWYARNKERAKEGMRKWRALRRAKPAEDLFGFIDKAVPKSLPPEIREDVIGNILLSVYEGETKISDLKSSVRQFIREYFKNNQDRYRFVSLDAPIKDGEGATLGELMVG